MNFTPSISTFTRIKKCCLSGLLALISLLPFTISAQGLSSGQITLVPNNTGVNPALNDNVVSSASELVTFGLPIADCTLFDTTDFKLMNQNGSEVAVFVKPTLLWPDDRLPCQTGSVRAIKVQFVFDATGNSPVNYSWNLSGRNTSQDRSESEVVEIQTDKAIKDAFMEPRVFAIHDPAYLVQSGIMPPTAVMSDDDYDTDYYRAKWEYDSRDFNYSTSTAANWLFDKVSTNYRQAMRRGDVEHYREAYLSHEFYIDKIEVTGRNTTQDDYCLGGFDYGGLADTYGGGGGGCDAKFVYVEPIKLHLALTGDDSWEPVDNGVPSPSGHIDNRDEAWIAMADLLYAGSYRTSGNYGNPVVPAPGFSEVYDDVNDHFTERKSGFGLQAVISSCELTLDDTVCGWADNIINNMYQMQTNNPDGRGNLGYLGHSWHRHEGSYLPWLGTVSQDYINASSIVIDNTVADGPATLISNNMIRIKGVGDVALTGKPVKNGNGSWTLSLAKPISISAGNNVVATFQDTSKNPNNLVLDLDTDRVFSPWMQAITADGIWQYYHWSDDPSQKQKAAALLLGFGRALAAYAFDGTRTTDTVENAIEAAFPGVSIFDTQISGKTNCYLVRAPYPRYVANKAMTRADLNRSYMVYMFSSGSFADQHIPEMVFQLSVGLYFETDPLKRVAMEALLTDLMEWFENWACTSGNKNLPGAVLGDPPRAFAWQNKSDPYGTYKYVTSENDDNEPSAALAYSSTVFDESNANDGSTGSSIEITLANDSFTNTAFSTPTHYAVSGLPAGMTPSMNRVSNNKLVLTLQGKASLHGNGQDTGNISLTFKDAAFTTESAVNVSGASKNGLSIDFDDAFVNYTPIVFSESNANDGNIDKSLPISLSGGETFIVSSGVLINSVHYSSSNVPAGLLPVVTVNSATSATLTFQGNALAHDNANDLSGVSVQLKDAAFNGASSASVVGSTLANLQLDFIDNIGDPIGGGSEGSVLSYNSTTFFESLNNTGQTTDVISIGLTGTDKFATGNGVMTQGVHYQASNVPEGMTLIVTGITDITATLELTGNAINHADINDVTDITVQFLDAAFLSGSVANITNVVNSSIAVNFNDLQGNVAAGQVYYNTDGKLVNISNAGTIVGGRLTGSIDNTGGTLLDVTLDKGFVKGGMIYGELLGAGKVINATLNLDALDSGIVLGRGTRLTYSTVKDVLGLELLSALRDDYGVIDSQALLVEDENQSFLSLAEIIVGAIDKYLGNVTGIKFVDDSSDLFLINDGLGNLIVPVTPESVMTSASIDGVRLNYNGQLQMIHKGLLMTFAPAPVDLEALSAEIDRLGAQLTLLENGVIQIDLDGVAYFLRFGMTSDSPLSVSEILSGAIALTEYQIATLELETDTSIPVNFRVKVHYPNQLNQDLVPYLHDLENFEWVTGIMGINYRIDPFTGIIEFLNYMGHVESRLMPDYATSTPGLGVEGAQLENAGDVNNDGVPDYLFATRDRQQILFGLPI